MTLLTRPIEFALPEENIATSPAERRGLARDQVRLMVTRKSGMSIEHDSFAHLDRHLSPGDLLVVNTSATMPAAVDASTVEGDRVKVHFASEVSGGLWMVEVRTPTADGGTEPRPDLSAQTLVLPGKVRAHLLAPGPRTPRLWVASVEPALDLTSYLHLHGEPIRYVPGPRWPIEDYQTVFATEPGSAEMPSAGRPFTTDLVTRLVARGVAIAPVVLHAGVSSYEDHETPGEERYDVPPATATVLNALRGAGGRVVAVGTTVVRALESVVDETGVVHPGRGITDLVVTSERGVRAVDGMLTGWHEPASSHLRMLEAFIPAEHLETIYQEAVASGYLWHEFGDELLILA